MQERNSRGEISVVVPVLREPRLDGLVRHVRDIAGPEPVQLVVVDGDPAGSSLAALRAAMPEAAACPDLILFAASPGRARQMNAGAARATGGILVFLHADTRLPAGAFDALRAALGTGLARAGSFDLAFDTGRPALRFVARVGSIRSRMERIPYGDQVHFFDAAYFRALGGYPDVPIMEDVELFRRIRRRGEGCVILPDRAVTSARRYERDGIARRVLGNWRLRLLHALGVPPRRLAGQYNAHGDDHDEK